VTVGGVTEPVGRIVNRAGTRTLIEPVVAVLLFVVVFGVGAVFVSVTVVAVRVFGAVVVIGGTVTEAVEVDAAEVDFEPPQPASASAPIRSASPLSFAG
jgi:hypothetical protein